MSERDEVRIMRTPDVVKLVGYSPMHISRLEKCGKFPRRFKIGSDSKSGAVGWLESEVVDWLRARAGRRAPVAA